MLALVLASLWQAAAGGPQASCPSGEAVAAELARLGTSAAVAKVGTPEVTVDRKRMRVSLRGQDGLITGVREVTAPADCQERAAVAATLISAWVGAWATGGFPEVDRPRFAALIGGERLSGTALGAAPQQAASTPPSPPPSATPEPFGAAPTVIRPRPPVLAVSPAAAPSLAPPAVATRAQAEPAPPPLAAAQPTVIAATAKPASRGSALGLELAGFASATYDGDAAALGGGVEVGLLLPDWLSLATMFETTAVRERRFDSAVAAYRAYRLGPGLGARRRWTLVFGEVSVFPEVMLLKVDGRNLAESRSVTTWGAAGDLRGRLGIPVGRFCPFLYAGASYAMPAQRLTLEGSPNRITLSRWNLSLGVGLSYRFGASDSR